MTVFELSGRDLILAFYEDGTYKYLCTSSRVTTSEIFGVWKLNERDKLVQKRVGDLFWWSWSGFDEGIGISWDSAVHLEPLIYDYLVEKELLGE